MGTGDGNIDIAMRMREEGVVRTSAEFVRWMKEADRAARNLTRSGRRAGRAVKDAGKDGAGGMGKLAAGAQQAMWAITGIGSATGVIYAVKRAVSALVEEFEKIRELKGETFAASVQAGQIFQKTAALPIYAQKYGDKALETVIAQGVNVALRAGATTQIAGESMFYTTSALSHLPEKQRLAAAEEMSRFGTVHEMTTEEMAGLPQLWKVEGAETAEEMRDVMNKVYVGVGESISTLGEALKHLPRLRAVQKQYGFSLAESLSMYTGALDIMNAAKAGQTSMIATELGMGRTKKALHYLRRVAKGQGIANYDALDPEERSRVMGAHIEQMVEQKDWKGVTGFFMAMGGGRGSGRMAFMQYSDTAQAKTESTRARLAETQGRDMLGDVYSAYDKTPAARQRRTDNMMFKSDVERGYENAGLAIHNQLVDKVVERLHEQAADPAKLAMITGMFGDMGAEAFRKNVGDKMIEASLTGIKVGDPNRRRAWELLRMDPQLWTTKPELMNDVMQITGDMQTWSQGTVYKRGQTGEQPFFGGQYQNVRPVGGRPGRDVPATETGAFAEAMKSVFGAEQLDVSRLEVKELVEKAAAAEFRKKYPSPMEWAKSRKIYPSPKEFIEFGRAYPKEMHEAAGGKEKWEAYVEKYEQKTSEAAKEQTEATKEQTEVLKEIRDRLPEQTPGGVPSGEMGSGNTDQ